MKHEIKECVDDSEITISDLPGLERWWWWSFESLESGKAEDSRVRFLVGLTRWSSIQVCKSSPVASPSLMVFGIECINADLELWRVGGKGKVLWRSEVELVVEVRDSLRVVLPLLNPVRGGVLREALESHSGAVWGLKIFLLNCKGGVVCSSSLSNRWSSEVNCRDQKSWDSHRILESPSQRSEESRISWCGPLTSCAPTKEKKKKRKRWEWILHTLLVVLHQNDLWFESAQKKKIVYVWRLGPVWGGSFETGR